jgi:anti-sigma B factor antagonist
VSDFQIDTEATAAGATLRLTGELDGATSGDVVAEFDQALRAGRKAITLDLAGVSFIDSAGLRAIILIQQRAAEQDVPLAIIPPPTPLLELLEITGLTERLVLASEDGAPASEQRYLERVDLELPRDASAPSKARDELRQAIENRFGEMEIAAAVLLASELVTNAVLHPAPAEDQPIELRISAYPDRVRVEVVDSGPGFDPDSLAERERKPESGGRGLMVVDRLASRWGIRPSSPGDGRFCVWYELSPDSAKPFAEREAG